MRKIHVPESICFGCTGCGNCCLQWPVPATSQDKEKISRLIQMHDTGQIEFRPFKSNEQKLQSFTHTLEKRTDGRCQFLTAENQCWLHLNFGYQAKPAMCQLFPYTFTETPSGVYAYISFAATGALLNSGPLLSQQEDLLESQYVLFRQLFSQMNLDWSSIQLIDGLPISWESYLDIETELIKLLRRQGGQQLDTGLADCSQFLYKQLPKNGSLSRLPKIEASQKIVDQLLLQHLYALYFPDNLFACQEFDWDMQGLLKQLIAPPATVYIKCGKQSLSFKELAKFKLGGLSHESEDLLQRYIYCRLFAKLYFGPGFANLSLIAGLHHLFILIILLRLKLKINALVFGRDCLEFTLVMESVRDLERRLTQVQLSSKTQAVLEVLLSRQQMVERLLYLAA